VEEIDYYYLDIFAWLLNSLTPSGIAYVEALPTAKEV
jgi:hypothetical protein